MFRTDAHARAVYSESAGVGRIVPRAVAVPADADDVVTLVRWAAHCGVPLTPRGSGSSMANGAIGPGVVVDMGQLRACGSVDAVARCITVGPAVTRDTVDTLAATAGLMFPVDPSSGAFATIGGMCATNAAGARSVRYGAMRRWVEALDCVFADGTRAVLRRGSPVPELPVLFRVQAEVLSRLHDATPAALVHAGVRKESSGYALAEFGEHGEVIDLIIGSEGTLALIVGVTLRLAPRPVATVGVLAGFPDLEHAAAAAVDLAAQGASAVELLDRTFLEIATEGGAPPPVSPPSGLEGVLLVEIDGDTQQDLAREVDALAARCIGHGATHIQRAIDEDTGAQLWALRHAASPILNRLAPDVLSMQVIEDGCVPPERFAEYVRGVRAALTSAGFRGAIFGHAGDGHAHVNALVDVRAQDWRLRLEQLLETVTALVARLGGTVAGEHGDGRLRAPLLEQVWSPEALVLFAATKRAFDPIGIFNPGVKIRAPGGRPLEDVKYDPALPPLPSPAREALDHIVRTKQWQASRLALLAEFSG